MRKRCAPSPAFSSHLPPSPAISRHLPSSPAISDPHPAPTSPPSVFESGSRVVTDPPTLDTYLHPRPRTPDDAPRPAGAHLPKISPNLTQSHPISPNPTQSHPVSAFHGLRPPSLTFEWMPLAWQLALAMPIDTSLVDALAVSAHERLEPTPSERLLERSAITKVHLAPSLTIPHHTSPHRTSPHLASPHLTSPYHTSPHHTPPYLTSTHFPHLTSLGVATWHVLFTLLPLVTRGMPSSPHLPWCGHVACPPHSTSLGDTWHALLTSPPLVWPRGRSASSSLASGPCASGRSRSD